MKSKKPAIASADTITEVLASRALELAADIGVSKLLVQADSKHIVSHVNLARNGVCIAWMTAHLEVVEFTKAQIDQGKDILLHVPESRLSRFSQLRVGLFLALAQEFLIPKERVICLLGAIGTGRLDTLTVVDPQQDFPWYHKHARVLTRLKAPIRAIQRVISCALRLANEGREGKPIGTTFVIGPLEQLERYTHQLILNPLSGHRSELRSIHRAEFFETIRELAALDGAFIVDQKGIVDSAGTYLIGPKDPPRDLQEGLGARHVAAAGITRKCKDAVAVTLSESSGVVRIFQGGVSILKLEKIPTEPYESSRMEDPNGA